VNEGAEELKNYMGRKSLALTVADNPFFTNDEDFQTLNDCLQISVQLLVAIEYLVERKTW